MIFRCGELQQQSVFLWYFWRWGGWGSLLLKAIGTQKLPLVLLPWWLLALLCPSPGCEVSQEGWGWPCPSALCPRSLNPCFKGFCQGRQPRLAFWGCSTVSSGHGQYLNVYVHCGVASSESMGQLWPAGAGHGALMLDNTSPHMVKWSVWLVEPHTVV